MRGPFKILRYCEAVVRSDPDSGSDLDRSIIRKINPRFEPEPRSSSGLQAMQHWVTGSIENASRADTL